MKFFFKKSAKKFGSLKISDYLCSQNVTQEEDSFASKVYANFESPRNQKGLTA